MPSIPLDSIFVPPRIRFETESYGDIPELADSLEEKGQIQSIYVRTPREDEDTGGKKWVLVDGGRRYAATRLLANRDLSIYKQDVGFIRADIDEEEHDELSALMLEFEANELREDFTWKEKAKFYTQAHEILSSRAKERDVKNWGLAQTGKVLGVTAMTMSRYLELTEDEELFESDEIQGSETFNTAHKKLKIAKEKKRRKEAVKTREKRLASKGLDVSDFYSMAASMCTQGDCREWLSDLPDSHFAWFHWDPPYGGEQGGGAFSSHEQIDDTEEYAKVLIAETLPEIYRTLAPGGWLVIWFHQSHREWLKNLLEAYGFWVNPYECIWYKANRHADGHEISRFLINAYEPFFLCGKPHEDGAPAVLNKSSAQNVFVHDLPAKSERRHPMHKPAPLLREVIEIISVPGEVGGDPSAGSGSIIEAALQSSRRIEVCELSEHYHLICVEEASNLLKTLGYEPKKPSEEDLPDDLTLS